jgi:hypothetical protein
MVQVLIVADPSREAEALVSGDRDIRRHLARQDGVVTSR